jgi:hydroxyacylglutathione hydrolase
MKQVADGVWHIDTIFMPNAVNAFVIEDVLIDAGGRYSGGRILKSLGGHKLSAHALTHAHPDHQGASHEICTKLEIPYWVGVRDVVAAENPDLIAERQPSHPIAQLMHKVFTGPAHPVDRQLHEGDEVAGFKVIDVPGHSAGHVAFWRESDGVLILGDVLNNQNALTGFPTGLREPYDFFTPDPAENRRSAKKLAPLEPKVVLFGHGPPHTDTKKFVEFVSGLPA